MRKLGKWACTGMVASSLLLGGAGLMTSSARAAEREERTEKFGEHPHLHRAIQELREARRELKEAPHDFGGHREEAIEAIDRAIRQLERAMKFAKR